MEKTNKVLTNEEAVATGYTEVVETKAVWTAIIHKEIWDDYYEVQLSGRINMLMHPHVELFMKAGRWEAAHRHFEQEKQTTPLHFELVHIYPCKGWRMGCECTPVEVVS
jgi:hypothetical protein